MLSILEQEPDKKCQNMDMIKMAKGIVMGDESSKEQAIVKAESCGIEFSISWDD